MFMKLNFAIPFVLSLGLASCATSEPPVPPGPTFPPPPPAELIDPQAPSTIAAPAEQLYFANCPQGFGAQPAECEVAP